MALDLVVLDDRFTIGLKRSLEGRAIEVVSDSGAEVRIQKWLGGRRAYDGSFKLRTMAEIQAFDAFFQAQGFSSRAFLMRDDADYTISNVQIGIGNGSNTVFQIVKPYDNTVNSTSRTIYYPASTSYTSNIAGLGSAPGVVMKVAGVTKTEGVDYTVNYTGKAAGNGGKVTFGTAPANGATVVVASCWFLTPVRFDMKAMASMVSGIRGDVDPVRLIEVFGE